MSSGEADALGPAFYACFTVNGKGPVKAGKLSFKGLIAGSATGSAGRFLSVETERYRIRGEPVSSLSHHVYHHTNSNGLSSMHSTHCHRKRFFRGFTLVEIMVVVSIIGFLAILAIPVLKRVQRSSQNTATYRTMRAFQADIEHYVMNEGWYPADRGPGGHPAEITSYTKVNLWDEPTPIGGQWDWDYDVFGFLAGISVDAPTVSNEQLIEFDKKLDDGNTSTGNIQLREAGITLVIEEY